MSEKNEVVSSEQGAVQGAPAAAEQTETLTGKRPFVEPEVSVPVDVMDTTTFFQTTAGTVVLP